jgi:hypothetical protein
MRSRTLIVLNCCGVLHADENALYPLVGRLSIRLAVTRSRTMGTGSDLLRRPRPTAGSSTPASKSLPPSSRSGPPRGCSWDPRNIYSENPYGKYIWQDFPLQSAMGKLGPICKQTICSGSVVDSI